MSTRPKLLECEEADKDVKAGPHAWIQWKGTQVCMDVHCTCGAHTHLDAEFAYSVQCGACGQVWAMCANVRMIPSTAEEAGQCCFVTSWDGEPRAKVPSTTP